MIRDTDWLEELRNDPSLYYFAKAHVGACDKIFKEWAISRLEYFEKYRTIGALTAEHIFQQLRQPGSLYALYEYVEPKHIVPHLQEAASRAGSGGIPYSHYYTEFRKDYENEGTFTRHNLSLLMRYMSGMAEDFTYHYIKVVHENDSHVSDVTLQKNPGLFSAPISSLSPHENTPEGKENLKVILRLVGRFSTHTQPTANKSEE